MPVSLHRTREIPATLPDVTDDQIERLYRVGLGQSHRIALRLVCKAGVVGTAAVLAEAAGLLQPPALDSLTPNTAVIGGPDLTLSVKGSGFNADTKIVFNGGEEPTTLVSATEVTTIVKPSTATTAGSYPVLVRGKQSDSDPLPFTFTAAPLALATAAKK